jgi:hypothetical protein
MISKKAAITGVATAILAVAAVSPVQAASSATVKSVPVSYTPWLLKSTPSQNVDHLVQCGSTMYAVGKITAIGQGSKTYTRGNAFSFSATTGAVRSWDPQVNGEVHSIALAPDCSTAYLGGAFTTVRGTTVKNIAAVDTTTGAVKTGWKHTAGAAVYTVQYTRGLVLIGGKFKTVNGMSRTSLASLNPTTGSVTAYANLPISGTYPLTTTSNVFDSQLSHSGSKMLIEGVFTSIAGKARRQVAVLDLGASSVTLNGWNAPEFNVSCIDSQSFYARAAAWSPADNAVYAVTTGYKPPTGPGSDRNGPRAGPCDAAFKFPASAGAVSHTWVNYTGCDSYYSVVADTNDVYVAGHERWANNPNGCDFAGPGAVSRPGIASLNATTGLANPWNPTRSLGHGADDLVLTAAGLWVASDNFSDGNAQHCGGLAKHGGICFFPY